MQKTEQPSTHLVPSQNHWRGWRLRGHMGGSELSQQLHCPTLQENGGSSTNDQKNLARKQSYLKYLGTNPQIPRVGQNRHEKNFTKAAMSESIKDLSRWLDTFKGISFCTAVKTSTEKPTSFWRAYVWGSSLPESSFQPACSMEVAGDGTVCESLCSGGTPRLCPWARALAWPSAGPMTANEGFGRAHQ